MKIKDSVEQIALDLCDVPEKVRVAFDPEVDLMPSVNYSVRSNYARENLSSRELSQV